MIKVKTLSVSLSQPRFQRWASPLFWCCLWLRSSFLSAETILCLFFRHVSTRISFNHSEMSFPVLCFQTFNVFPGQPSMGPVKSWVSWTLEQEGWKWVTQLILFRGRAQWHVLQCATHGLKCPTEGKPLSSDPIWDNASPCAMPGLCNTHSTSIPACPVAHTYSDTAHNGLFLLSWGCCCCCFKDMEVLWIFHWTLLFAYLKNYAIELIWLPLHPSQDDLLPDVASTLLSDSFWHSGGHW